MTDYPEHEKMKAVREESQTIGEFLDFGLAEQGLRLCAWSDELDGFFPTSKTIQQILAEHFDIDLDTIEEEKRAMLDELRTA